MRERREEEWKKCTVQKKARGENGHKEIKVRGASSFASFLFFFISRMLQDAIRCSPMSRCSIRMLQKARQKQKKKEEGRGCVVGVALVLSSTCPVLKLMRLLNYIILLFCAHESDVRRPFHLASFSCSLCSRSIYRRPSRSYWNFEPY